MFENKTKLLFSYFYFCLFLTKLVKIRVFDFANKRLFDGEIKIFIFCLILVCHNKMHVAKSLLFAVFRHNTSPKKCSIRIQKLPAILQLNSLANMRSKN